MMSEMFTTYTSRKGDELLGGFYIDRRQRRRREASREAIFVCDICLKLSS